MHLFAQGGYFQEVRQFHGGTGDYFGQSLSNAGDVNADGIDDLIVGAPLSSPGGQWAVGAVYVFSGLDGSLLHQWQGPYALFSFGFAVDGAGDVNGDGHDDLIVGATNGSLTGHNAVGSIWVYSGLDGSLLYQMDGSQAYGYFGSSVAGAGDVDGDGFHDFLVGAYGLEHGGIFWSGSAFVYSGATGGLLHSFQGGPGDHLGWSVAGEGDVNGDGYDDVLVGTPVADSNGTPWDGYVRIYSGQDGSLLRQLNSQTTAEQFGHSLSFLEDVDGDSLHDLIVGAPVAWPNGIYQAGSAYVFSGATGALLQAFHGTQDNDFFGWSVAGIRDINGDDTPELLVGAPATTPEPGSARVFCGQSGTLLHELWGQNQYDQFGWSVADAGDPAGNGQCHLTVGARRADPQNQLDAGSAYLYAFNPVLSLSSNQLSATQGGRVDFDLDFPAEEAGQNYILLASLSGTGPWSQNGLDIPLTYDALTQAMIQSPPPLFHQSTGLLDNNGDGQAWLQAAPGQLASYIGMQAWFAAVAYESTSSLHLVSVAVALEIVP